MCLCVRSRPRGAVGSGAAAVEMAADPVVAWSCGAGALVWVGLVVRFVCVIRVPVCARVCPLSRLAACPGSPRCLFTGTLGEAEHTPNALPSQPMVLIHASKTGDAITMPSRACDSAGGRAAPARSAARVQAAAVAAASPGVEFPSYRHGRRRSAATLARRSPEESVPLALPVRPMTIGRDNTRTALLCRQT